jgi:transcriptional regulator with XRE-family HTH domain
VDTNQRSSTGSAGSTGGNVTDCPAAFPQAACHCSTCSAEISRIAMVKNPVDKHVGARLRMRRLMLNRSQSQIANALGLTFQQVQKYEKGSNRISASRLQQMCSILQVPVSFFFEGAPQAFSVPDLIGTEVDDEAAVLTGFLATSDGLALATAYSRIRDAKVRRAIVALVEEITD